MTLTEPLLNFAAVTDKVCGSGTFLKSMTAGGAFLMRLDGSGTLTEDCDD